MVVGVPLESCPGERRVSRIPSFIDRITKLELDLIVQKGASITQWTFALLFLEYGRPQAYENLRNVDKGSVECCNNNLEKVGGKHYPYHNAYLIQSGKGNCAEQCCVYDL